MDKSKIPEDETDLDLALEQIQSDYQRLQNEGPPDLVDQAVLNLARREAEAQRTTRRRRMQWVGALSSMALLVVTLNLVVDQQSPGPRPMDRDMDKSTRMKQESDAANGAALERRQPAPEPEEASQRQAAPMLQSIGVSSEAAPADQGEALLDEDYKNDPDAWLEHILDLLDRGLDEQAETEVQALREAYPEFPLPEKLQ